MSATLTLDLPWVDSDAGGPEGLRVQSGRNSQLAYEDGIVLNVEQVDPLAFSGVEELLEAVGELATPGQLVLVVGSVPLDWRAALRDSGVSFFDVSGVAEINWPRLKVSERRFGRTVKRQRSSLPLQKGHGLVAQELLVLADERPSIGELASSAGVTLPTASKAVTQLAAQGLVARQRSGNRVLVEVSDELELARRLGDATRWPGRETLFGYMWGQTVFDVAARLSSRADAAGIPVAVTGRVAAAYRGLLGTGSPSQVLTWARDGDRGLAEIAADLGLEPAPEEAANVLLSSDPWRLGTSRRERSRFDGSESWVAHPLRIWCDLPAEPRGREYATQMWRMVIGGD